MGKEYIYTVYCMLYYTEHSKYYCMPTKYNSHVLITLCAQDALCIVLLVILWSFVFLGAVGHGLSILERYITAY